ncbi:hypothetical protein LOZ58_000207 [Ophidiomyces ophidiicola]|nr:hypothetical protein LOZ58_000207 [Ophidiomyces ophidiicola]
MSSKSSRNNKRLASEIEEIGVVMSSRCPYCSHHDKECIHSEKSIKCSECCRLGCRCITNSTPSDRDWQSLQAARDKLELEETKAFEAVQAASAKLLRLQKQKRFLRDRAGKFLESGLRSLEELERLEEEEKKRVAEQTEVQNRFASLNDFPPAGSLSNFPNSFINSVLHEGVVDDTSQQSSGHS